MKLDETYKQLSELLEARRLDKEIEKGKIDTKINRYGKSKSYDWGKSGFKDKFRSYIPPKLEQEKFKNDLTAAKEAKTEVENFLKTDWFNKGDKFLDVAEKLTNVYEKYMNDIMDKHSKFKLDSFYKLWNGLANDGYEDQFNGYELRLNRKDDTLNSLLLDTLKKYDQEKFKTELKQDLVKNGYNENVATVLTSIANTYLKQIEKLMSLFKISVVADMVNESYSHTAKLLGERYEGLLVESSKQDVEEFKKDLKEKFFKKFKGLLDAKSVEDKELNFSLESALYWFGNDYHSGQSDIWYAVMSSSEYRPGRSEGSIEDTEDNDAQMFYDFLEKDQKRKEKRVDESAYEKSLKPFINIKVTYNDGSVLKTQLRLTLEEAKKYYMGMGNVVNWEDEDTGKEYKHKAVKVELDESVQLKESKKPTGKLIRISYENWDEDSLDAGETDDKGWEDEEGVNFSDDPDETPAKDAIKFLRKKYATNLSSKSYSPDVWYSSEDKNIKSGDVEIKSYHLYGDWTDDEKKEIFKGIAK